MFRKGQIHLKHWLHKQGRKPLVLRGARQVGKSTLVRLLAEDEKLDLCEINLEKYPDLEKVFKTFQIKPILTELQAILQKKIHQNSLLFLDEIQAVPVALACLRYFYEERPDLPVIAAGSLLDFVLEEADFSVPVGRIEYYHLGPFSFEEFLKAHQEEYLLSLAQTFSLGEKLSEFDHQKLLNYLRSFYFVGGMPEAVLRASSGGLPEEVRSVHQTLIATYQDDFNKYAKRQDIPLLHEVFKKVSLSVGRKVKYTELARDEKSRDVKKVLQLLIKAKLVHPVYHSQSSGIPLQAMMNPDVYKLLYLDLGLFNSALGLGWKELHSLKNDEIVTAGMQAEQYVGQSLLYRTHLSDPELFYWQREEKANLAEVDYVIQVGSQIIPVEVKAGSSGKLKSLHQFVAGKDVPLALKFDTELPSQAHVSHAVKTAHESKEIQFELVTLPLYLAGQVDRILAGQS